MQNGNGVPPTEVLERIGDELEELRVTIVGVLERASGVLSAVVWDEEAGESQPAASKRLYAGLVHLGELVRAAHEGRLNLGAGG